MRIPFFDGVDASAVAVAASVDAPVAIAGVTLPAIDLDAEMNQTALDRHDRQVGWLGDEDGVDRWQPP
jgi:hypothetical protein